MRLPTLLLVLAVASPADAVTIGVRQRVSQDPSGDFTVQYDSQAKLTDYWCAAGRFVSQTLGLPDRTRVYRQSPEPRKIGKGITFTLDATRSSGKTGITTFGGPQDGSMSAGGAETLCFGFDLEYAD